MRSISWLSGKVFNVAKGVVPVSYGNTDIYTGKGRAISS